ncbi:MAG: hypothetical protein NT173_00420, partial [Opitutales bacterium]|nr:hypothetical protein [Opitutales bacterium]
MSRDASVPSLPARPRVLQVITRLGLGGAEAVAFSLMRGLRDEFDFACFAVRGVESGDLGRALQAQLQALAIPLYCGPRWPLRLGGMVPAGLRAGQVVRQFRPGLLHLHTEIPESTYAALAALRPGVAEFGLEDLRIGGLLVQAVGTGLQATQSLLKRLLERAAYGHHLA